MEITKRDEKIAVATGNQLTPEQVAIVKSTVAKNTSDLELAYFLNVAASQNLSPFNKEVWCYKDLKKNLIVFAGRDGFLKAAQRNPKYNGIASSEVRENDVFSVNIPEGKINHTFGFKDRGRIVGGYAIAKPKGCEIATIEVVDFDVYNKNYNTWKSHPADMIKKVAETHCLKKAYGISGLQSEYDYSVNNEIVVAIDTDKKPTNDRLQYFESLVYNSSHNDEEKDILMSQMESMSNTELDHHINLLKQNQVEGMEKPNPQMKDIQNKLDDVMNDERK